MTDKFYIKRYDYERGYDDEDDELVDESVGSCDLREALSTITDNCSDYEDWRSNEVILYPADTYMNMRGIIQATHVVIGSTNERHFDRFARLYERMTA